VEPKIIFSKRKSVALQIGPKGLVVRVPMRTSLKYIQQLLESKKEWIESKIKILQKKQEVKTEDFLNTENDVWLFGRKIELDMESKILDLKKFYKKELEGYLNDKLVYYANLVGVNFAEVKVKKLKSKWGSCSSKGVLVFNSSLAKCPLWIIDYVIIHELCHRKQMNHSKKFWDLVELYYPDWKQVKKWFKIYGENVGNTVKMVGNSYFF
jgi:predicted metal-dependent hydrolase